MRIIETNLQKDFVKLIPESFDDLWHLYNIIYEDDRVYAHTSREVEPDREYSRPGKSQRISVFLGIEVEEVYLDKLLNRLRVHGIIRDGPDTVPLGSHHTIDISLNKPVTIVKENWAGHHLERLKRAMRTSEKPIIIISIDDEGYAIATTKQYGIEVKIEENIKLPSKREADQRGSAIKRFFDKASKSLRRIWSDIRSPIAVLGVGFIKNDFARFLQNEDKDLAEAVVDVKGVNNTGVAGIYEALRSGVLSESMEHMRITRETEVIKEILKRLGQERYDIVYGLEDVKKASELGAIDKIVLADIKLRRTSDQRRLMLEELMKEVEQKGGEVMIVSTEHEAGEELMALGGIAALLRFRIS
ncbi:MAG: mRNA surveillance protein pelota [Thermoproteota archaeon]